MAKEKIMPEHTVRVGSIQIAIWSNKTDKGVFRSISIDKSYKDGDEWKRSKSFKPNDILFIQIALNKVAEYLYDKTTTTSGFRDIKADKNNDTPF